MIPTCGIRATGLEFETHLACVGREIVGHWFNAPVCFATWTNRLLWILTLAIVAETNACGFWSNDNRDSNMWYQSDRSRVQNSFGSCWGGDCWTLGSTLLVCYATWTNRLSWILTLAIVVETNAYGFWSNGNRDSNKRLIVGHWFQRSLCVSRHGLTTSRGS